MFLKDDTYIGWIVLNHLDNTSDIEIGYRFLPEFWGRGYATEIATTVRDYGFRDLNLHRIAAVAAPDNIASQQVLKKIGLTFQKPTHYYGVDVFLFRMDNPNRPHNIKVQ